MFEIQLDEYAQCNNQTIVPSYSLDVQNRHHDTHVQNVPRRTAPSIVIAVTPTNALKHFINQIWMIF
jgi:hypothetical protein